MSCEARPFSCSGEWHCANYSFKSAPARDTDRRRAVNIVASECTGGHESYGPPRRLQDLGKAPMRRMFKELVTLPRNLKLRFLLCQVVASSIPKFSLSTVRAGLYRAAGFHISRGVAFEGKLDLVGAGKGFTERLEIGRGTVMGVNVQIYLDDKVTIEENVAISPEVRILTSSHLIGPQTRRMNPHVFMRPVSIESGVWIGFGAVIMPGVTIGSGSVVSAHAVVTKDVPANSLVVGSPATVVDTFPVHVRRPQPGRSPCAAPLAAIREKAMSLASETFGILFEDFFDELGPANDRRWTSTKHVKLMERVAEEFGHNFDENEYVSVNSFGQLLRLLYSLNLRE